MMPRTVFDVLPPSDERRASEGCDVGKSAKINNSDATSVASSTGTGGVANLPGVEDAKMEARRKKAPVLQSCLPPYATVMLVVAVLCVVLTAVLLTQNDNSPPAEMGASGTTAQEETYAYTLEEIKALRSTVEQRIRGVAVYGGQEFEGGQSGVADTYQKMALEWAKNHAQALSDETIVDTERLRQWYVLACFYALSNTESNVDLRVIGYDEANRGYKYAPKWTHKWALHTDTSGAMAKRADTNECEWTGVSCNSQNQVTSIRVPGNNLQGLVCPELQVLVTNNQLDHFDVSSNPNLGRSDGRISFPLFLKQQDQQEPAAIVNLAGTGFGGEGVAVIDCTSMGCKDVTNHHGMEGDDLHECKCL